MKTFRFIGMALVAVLWGLGFTSCGYDDDKLWDSFNQLEDRVAMLETLCKQNNENISSLQTIVSGLKSGDYITDIVPITNDGEEIGYKITFAKKGTITIYNGKDGTTPIISVKQDKDGNYYWTVNGEFVEVNGQKLNAQGKNGEDGKDGVTPELKIENGYWYVSYNGTNWTKLGKAIGEDGANGNNGDCIFSSVTQDEENVYFTLTNGTIITIAKNGNNGNNDGDEGGQTSVKKLTKISSPDDDLKVCFKNATYDDKGRILSFEGDLVEIYSNQKYTFEYEEGIITGKDGSGRARIHTLVNGLITYAKDPYNEYTFEYDDNKRLVKVNNTTEDEITEFVWENGNLTKVVDKTYNDEKIFTYTDKEAEILHFDQYADLPYVVHPFLLKQGYFGNSVSKNLIDTKITGSVRYYTYTIENGYVTHFKRTKENSSENYYFTWE